MFIHDTKRPAGTIFSARALFALAGFAVAAWAPLVPYVKAELNLSHLELSHLILLMGSGSIIGMICISLFLRYIPMKWIFAAAAVTINAALLSCILINDYSQAAIAIFSFGFALGILEVGGNIYASYLEDKLRLILLPSMHGCYSVGEIGALITAVVLLGLNLGFIAALFVPCALLSLTVLSTLGTIKFSPADFKGQKKSSALVIPKGAVLMFALVSSLIYMVEGGMLDWSALFLLQKTDIPLNFASSGYVVLVTAMAASRFAGAYLIGRFKTYKVLSVSVLLCALSLIAVFFIDHLLLLYVCFLVLGLSLANVMPICISLAGKQKSMPVLAAISAVSTCGYGALIVGPALIGYLAEHLTLNGAFFTLGLAVLALTVLICATPKVFSHQA
ncbi:MAG: hypothetical protein IAB19_08850 [Proteobacteria bacterium]|uniref:MFS transporter n=1 Tax=Candidatus Avisuccinivibrio stercorigallinarum TaxID=2840704 RepID=A0A9D9DCG9_9GAMM|nr:hypothetical protein [Candidatus Avisuccinivibrio stercorigallinarum]